VRELVSFAARCGVVVLACLLVAVEQSRRPTSADEVL